MAIDQVFAVVKAYFPATLGAVIGAWNKRGDKNSSIVQAFKTNGSDKVLITFVALFAIVVGVSIGKWVSVALVGYYDLPTHVIPALEFVTALNGIKLVDSVVKGVDKSLDVIAEKLPKLVSNILDKLSDKFNKWFG